MHVDRNLNYKVLESMTTVIDNLLQCITIEICKEKKSVYRELQALVLKYLGTG